MFAQAFAEVLGDQGFVLPAATAGAIVIDVLNTTGKSQPRDQTSKSLITGTTTPQA